MCVRVCVVLSNNQLVAAFGGVLSQKTHPPLLLLPCHVSALAVQIGGDGLGDGILR